MISKTLMRAACLIGAMLLPGLASAEKMRLDPGHTYPNFTVDHLGFSVMHGRFNESSGHIEVDGGKPLGLEVLINTASIDTGHEERDEHLRGEDFLHVEKYPTMVFRSKDIQRHSSQRATVNGELTLLGVTRPVLLHVDAIRCGQHPMNQKYTCGFNATASLKRSEFGMTAYLPAVGDMINIRIEAEAARETDTAGPRK